MALSKLELAVDTGKWDAGIKKAQTALRNFANSQGGVQQALQKSSDKTMKFVKMMGDMQSKAETSKGKANDYKRAIEQLSAATEHMNSAQKKVADDAIAKLTKRFHEAKTQADNLNKSLNDTKIPTGNFSGILHDVGSKLGINSNLLSVATTGTIGYAAAIGGAAVAVGAATKAWSEYNTELAKQDQITSVTTGLNRGAAEEMTNKVSALAKTYGVDFRESINAVNILMNQFGKSADESFDILSKGMRGMIAGDGGKLLQMIQQYAPAFRDAGIEASQLVAIIHNSEGGLFTDQNMNAIVMGIKNVRMMKDTTKDALRSIGIDADEMAKKLNDGTMSVFDALRQISSKIDEVGSGSQAAGEIMNDIFGKQGVTAGTNLGKAIESLNLNLDETMKQTGKVGEAMGELQRANERLNNQIRETFGYKGWEEMEIGIKTKLVGALADVLEAVNEFKEAVNETGSAAQIAWDSYTNALTAQLPIWAQLIAKVREYWKEVRGGDTQEEEPAGWKGDKPTIAKPGEVNDVAEEAKKQLAQTKQWKKTGGSGGGGDNRFDTFKLQLKQFKAEIADPGFGGGIDGGALWKMLGGDISIKKLQDMKSVLQQQFNEATSDQDRLKLQADIELTQGWIEALQAPGEWTIDENGVRIPLKMEIDHDALMKSAEEFNKNIQEQTHQKPSTIGAGYSKGLGMANQAYGGVKEIVGGLESLGIEFGKGFKDFMSKLDGVMSILNGINTIISVINSVRDTAYQSTMIGLTTTIAAAAVIEAAKPFARGGIVAEGGAIVPGSSLSGDLVPARINSGEMILNKQEQRNLFEQLRDGQPVNGTSVAMGHTRVQGRDLLLAINNELRATGRRTL